MTLPEAPVSNVAGEAPASAAAPASTPVTRRGPLVPSIALVAGVISMILVFPITVVAWPFMLVALVCGIVSVRRKHRLWGLGVVGIVLFAIAFLLMWVTPVLMLMLTWAVAGQLGDAGTAWNMFWGLCWFSWLGPLAPA